MLRMIRIASTMVQTAISSQVKLATMNERGTEFFLKMLSL